MQINSFQLKIIACASMLVDHIGLIFFPRVAILRIIGRIALPIFAFLIVEGYKRTRNFQKYLLRLVIFFLISQPIYLYAGFKDLNIFATLILGLCAIYLYDNIKNKKYGLFAVFLISVLACVIGADYAFFGVLLIFSFYLYNIKDNFDKLFFTQLLLTGAYIIYLIAEYKIFNIPFSIGWLMVQFVSLLALFLIKYYNGQRGRPVKYLFYAFYPVHLFILGIILHLGF
jgi:hypothetical protein